MNPVRFCYEDGTLIAEIKFARRQYQADQTVTLEPVATGEYPRTLRVVAVDHGCVQTTPKSNVYKESTSTVYVVDVLAPDDPRRDPR